MNTAIDFKYLDEIGHNHALFEQTVARAQPLFLDGWIATIGLSGKDSGAASICLVEALRRAKAIKDDVGPLHVVTTNTTLENIVLHDYIMSLHNDVVEYGERNNLPIFSHELRPSLAAQPIVEYI
ncbi:hypothetical protein GCM10009347_26630 [Shewanella algicola]|uniref:Uncharacterized protein n=1 Tax=Shewanella algicola TaxID=640633 RepID=A0A9X1ZGC6_9GAMM|nr:hypothetical protein [Shewanella algicola]MCL1106363.1 hypothetical protein [Shewanella algicola]GGP58905.1 hypothetical protein GCM10009347_26630 [Shewanella algicola]